MNAALVPSRVDRFARALARCGHRATEHSRRYAAWAGVRGPLPSSIQYQLDDRQHNAALGQVRRAPTLRSTTRAALWFKLLYPALDGRGGGSSANSLPEA